MSDETRLAHRPPDLIFLAVGFALGIFLWPALSRPAQGPWGHAGSVHCLDLVPPISIVSDLDGDAASTALQPPPMSASDATPQEAFAANVSRLGWNASVALLPDCAAPANATCGSRPCGTAVQPCAWHPKGAPPEGCACPQGTCMIAAGRCVQSPLLVRASDAGRTTPPPGACVGDDSALPRQVVPAAFSVPSFLPGADGGFDFAPPPPDNGTTRRSATMAAPRRLGGTRGGHDAGDGVYTLENVCVRGDGALLVNESQWGPSAVEAFEGVFPEPAKYGTELGEMQRFLRRRRQISEAELAGAVWIDDAAALHFPGFSPKSEKHQMNRFAPLVGALRGRVGPGHREAAVAVYVVTEAVRKAVRFVPVRGYAHFLPLVSRRWLAVAAARDVTESDAELRRPADPDPDGPRAGAERAVVCFGRPVMLSHPCRVTCAKVGVLRTAKDATRVVREFGQPRPPVLEKNPLLALAHVWCSQVYPRTVGSQFMPSWVNAPLGAPDAGDEARFAAVRASMQRCAGVRGRAAANTTHPKVVIAWRSGSRRFVGFSVTAEAIARYAIETLHARSVELVEHTALPSAETVRRYSDADVLIGRHGGGLSWAFLMPPGATVIQIADPQERRIFTEYRLASRASGHRWLDVHIGPVNCRPEPRGTPVSGLPTMFDAAAWRSMLQGAACALRTAADKEDMPTTTMMPNATIASCDSGLDALCAQQPHLFAPWRL